MLTLTFRRPMLDWQKLVVAGRPFLDVSPRIRVNNGVEVVGLRLKHAGTVADIAVFDARTGDWLWGGQHWDSFLLQNESLEDHPKSMATEEGELLPEESDDEPEEEFTPD